MTKPGSTLPVSTLRNQFLTFFDRHDHTIVRSANLVPENDPTLYFVNAGMVPFKQYFTGKKTAPYTRAVSAQKCLRVAGKHNDLEEVGRTPKHHTFFEMLGNFSFGDYFKSTAIELAWTFLTKEIGLDTDRLVATVFEGDDQCPADDEAYELWHTHIGLPKEKVYRLSAKDNFWAMGNTGPCGPCSEVHYFVGPKADLAASVAAGGPDTDERWVEIWNLVFMQYEKISTKIKDDSGIRLAMLEKPGIADHARAIAFCVADGVFPEKSGREYVLRRISRRAIRFGKKIGIETAFFHKICAKVSETMGEHYPELIQHRDIIVKVAEAEEQAFRRTLDRGLSKLKKAITTAKKENATLLSNSTVGDLYATDGFPTDLTKLIAAESDLNVDETGAKNWVKHTHGAKNSKIGSAETLPILIELESTHGPTHFDGYCATVTDSEIVALIDENGGKVESLRTEQTGIAILNRTSFYARSGGQVGDTGTLTSAANTSTRNLMCRVIDTTKSGTGLFAHHIAVDEGEVQVGNKIHCQVNKSRRDALARNHSATHLLHAALKQTLGNHVAQKGSEVTPTAIRFDISHFEPIKAEEIKDIERQIHHHIRANYSVDTKEMSYSDAISTGATALFGEKYGDKVRVVHIGTSSTELCGGTHVTRSGDIGHFRIISDESLAMGVRRIIATSGSAALELEQKRDSTIRKLSNAVQVAPKDLVDRVEKLITENKSLTKELIQLRQKMAIAESAEEIFSVGNIEVLIANIGNADMSTLRNTSDVLLKRVKSGVIVIGSIDDGAARIIARVTKDTDIHAGKLVNELATMLDGKGGGRPDFAQAGGSNTKNLQSALERAPKLVKQLILT